MKTSSFVLLLCLLTMPICLGGCGGQTASGTSKGRLVFTVRWPSGRLIPAASQSIRVQAFSLEPEDAGKLGEAVISRGGGGSSSAELELPSIKYRIEASAHPNEGGAGVAQAKGSVELIVEAQKTSTITLDMTSTIASIQISPANPRVDPGGTVDLTATAVNAQGEMVLVAPQKWHWSIANTDKATIEPQGERGRITGVKEGTTRVTARDTESGKEAEVELQVGPAVTTPLTGTFEGKTAVTAEHPEGQPIRLVISESIGGPVPENIVRIDATIDADGYPDGLYSGGWTSANIVVVYQETSYVRISWLGLPPPTINSIEGRIGAPGRSIYFKANRVP